MKTKKIGVVLSFPYQIGEKQWTQVFKTVEILMTDMIRMFLEQVMMSNR